MDKKSNRAEQLRKNAAQYFAISDKQKALELWNRVEMLFID